MEVETGNRMAAMEEEKEEEAVAERVKPVRGL